MASNPRNSLRLNSVEEKALHSFLEKVNSEMLRVGFPPVSTAIASKFLMARKFNVERAMELFKRHLEVREKYKMVTIQPLREPLSTMLTNETFTFLKRGEENKPDVILVRGKYYKHDRSQTTTVVQALIFQLDEALRNLSTQRNGLMVIYDMRESGRGNFNYSMSLEILKLFKNAYPAKTKKILIISPPAWFKLFFEIIAMFLNSKIRDRVEFTTVEGLSQHIEQECIPNDLTTSHRKWIETCLQSYKDGECDEPCWKITEDVKQLHFFKDASGANDEPSSSVAKESVLPAETEPIIPRPTEPEGSRKCDGLTVSQLMEHMKTNGPRGLKKEYGTIKAYDEGCKYEAFKLPENKTKNRYVDVICLDDSRVHIPVNDGAEGTDYIHANFIDGYYRKNAYIAAQGPLPSTFDDFWQMIWVTGSSVIIMLTKEVQRGRIKCGRYWPDLGNNELYRDLVVRCTEEIEQGEDFIIRTLTITDTKTNEEREVKQVQMVSWPDFGVPDSAEPIFQLKKMVEDYQAEVKVPQSVVDGTTLPPPVVVHCSAGIGRTGSYCTISIGIDSLLDNGHCNIKDTVTRMRTQRALTVQTADQYVLCYTALLEYAALHVDSIGGQGKIDILDFLNEWKIAEPSDNMTW